MKNVALVLSSGGALGFAHIGVIRELERRGYNITSIAGTSIGSMVGGFKAIGMLDKFESAVTSLTPDQIYKLMDFTISQQGFLKAGRFFEYISNVIEDRNIEDLEIPLAIVATDILSGQEVVFNSGSLYKAIRASIAIPAVITSVKDNDRLLVDGCVLNPLPINRVCRTEGDIVVAVNLHYSPCSTSNNYESSLFENCDGYVRRLYRGYKRITKHENGYDYISLVNTTANLMFSKIVELTVAIEKPDILINIPCNNIGVFDFHRSKELIDIGVKLTAEVLDTL